MHIIIHSILSLLAIIQIFKSLLLISRIIQKPKINQSTYLLKSIAQISKTKITAIANKPPTTYDTFLHN